VTPLQMASAVSVVANGGELVQPRVVRAVIRDGKRQPVPRKVVRRVINQETAAELTTIMERVVTDGTGKNSSVDGFAVAGKTGTAAKIVNGRYSTTDYNVSFVGFLPARNPAFTIVVMIDSPCRRTPPPDAQKMPCSPYGGFVAAPIFHNIAQAALRHRGIAPTINAPPPLLVARREESPDLMPTAAARPAIVPVSSVAPGGTSVFPDLRGMSSRESLRVLAQLGMTARLRGAGLVVAQQPEPGSPIERGSDATLWLDRAPTAIASNGPER
jgi:cell division protein FtsI (penicillin-binding protein 3)